MSKWKIIKTKVEKSIFCPLIEFSICCHRFSSPLLLCESLFGKLNIPWTLFNFTRTGALNNICAICSVISIIVKKKKKTHKTQHSLRFPASDQIDWWFYPSIIPPLFPSFQKGTYTLRFILFMALAVSYLTEMNCVDASVIHQQQTRDHPLFKEMRLVDQTLTGRCCSQQSLLLINTALRYNKAFTAFVSHNSCYTTYPQQQHFRTVASVE